MDIVIVSSGRKFFKVDPTLATILLELLPGAVQQIEHKPPAPQPLTVKWGIKTFPSGQSGIQRSCGSRYDYFNGWPQHAANHFKEFFKDEPPLAVQREYAACYSGNQNAPEWVAFQNFKKKLGIEEHKLTPLEEKQRADYQKFRHGG